MTADLATAKADVKIVKADVKAAHPTKAQKAVLNAFVKDESKILASFSAKNKKIITTGKSAGAGLESALKSLEKHPSLGAKAKVAKALLKLENVFSAQALNAIQTYTTTAFGTLDADLNAVAAAVPSAQADITTVESHLASDLTTIPAQMTAIQTDILKLATDLA